MVPNCAYCPNPLHTVLSEDLLNGDGNFEDPVRNMEFTTVSGNDLAPWAITKDDAQIVNFDFSTLTPTPISVTQAFKFIFTDKNDVLEYAVPTEPGKMYKITFWYAPDETQDSNKNRLIYSWNEINRGVIRDESPDDGILEFQQIKFVGEASTGKTTWLRFRNRPKSSIGPYLDRITVHEVSIDENFCGSCEYGFFSDGGVCTACEDSIPFCEACDTVDVCDKCAHNYEFNAAVGECIPICHKGSYYDLDDEKCKYCTDFDYHCEVCESPGVCTECNDGLFVDEGKCSDCSERVENCKECEQDGICTKCSYGHYLFTPFDDQESCPPCYDAIEYCSACSSDGSKCHKCIRGWEVVDGQCEKKKSHHYGGHNNRHDRYGGRYGGRYGRGKY